ncbi:hypothetical protein [Planococcus sp. ISL-110]|uniref:DUF7713 domain-containing protein n=1 Tax=Planococcus sp. ISL-110 TaxID=2819167 RepID=UPI001BEA043B|nr:hypothetical protein [Planococcus sp. ISL-110]MBT2572036.1 hypothetical protein [Planococcus sp. ISL-110]
MELMAKAERGMAEQYVERGTFPNGQSYDSIKNNRLAGRVEWNPRDEDVPLLVVDGNFLFYYDKFFSIFSRWT